MRRIHVLLIAGLALAAAVITACAVNPVSGSRELVLLNEAEEIKLGRDNDVQIRKQYDVVKNPALQAYVQQVGERLAACVNIFPRIRSVYRWRGAVERGEEAAMIVKTTGAKVGPARAAIERLHPYETPVIAAIAIDAGMSGGAFADWVRTELTETIR